MGKPKQRFRLTELKLSEVSLVDRGANQHSSVLLFKRDISKETDMTDKIVEQLAQVTKTKDDLEAANKSQQTEINFLKQNLEKLNARVATVEAEKAELEKKIKPEDKPIELPQEAKDQIAKALKDAAEATAALEKMRDETDTNVFVAKAQSYKALQQKPEEFGLVLKRIARNKATADDVIALEAVLKAASSAIETGVLTEKGTSNGGNASAASEKLDAIAKKIASEDKVDYAKAYAKALDQNPDLYTQYMAERQ